MYQTKKTYITPTSKMLDLINDNHSLLLLLQHFNIDFAVSNATVKELCSKNNVSLNVFLLVGNLYNDFYPEKVESFKNEEVKSLLTFLKNSHALYIEDKYPELNFYLQKIKDGLSPDDFKLIEKFFNDYYSEVLDHFKYEDEIVFPYFCSLINNSSIPTTAISVEEYRNHHTDIETKLTDLKNLFLKHISIKNELSAKRKFLNSLFELEFDLTIHSIIEEKILIPLVEKIESERNG